MIIKTVNNNKKFNDIRFFGGVLNEQCTRTYSLTSNFRSVIRGWDKILFAFILPKFILLFGVMWQKYKIFTISSFKNKILPPPKK